MINHFKQSGKSHTNMSDRTSKSALALSIILFVILSLTYNTVIPLFEGFDEAAYYSYITYLHTERSLPDLDHETAAYSYELIAQPPLYPLLAAVETAPFSMRNAHDFAWNSRNIYHGSLSKRQSITLPNRSWTDTMPVRIARLVSMLGGLITVWASWLLARILYPESLTTAIAVVSVVGFNPQFLFMSATVTNDAWSAGTIALSVAIAAHFWWPKEQAVEQPVAHSASMWFVVGLCAGCAVLTKYSGFLLALPMSILLIVYARRNGIWQALQAIGYAILGAMLIAGGWYLRNLWLWGELIPMTQMSTVLPTLLRPEPYSLARTLAHIPWLIASYWGVFVSIIGPGWYLESTQWFMGIGCVGLVIHLLRSVNLRKCQETEFSGKSSVSNPLLFLTMALVWCSGAALSVLYWTRTIDYGEQGRLLHIAAPGFALLWVVGWQALLPQKWHRGLHCLIILFMLGLGISQIFTLQDAYEMPASITKTDFDRPIQAQFAGGMQLLGIDLPDGAAAIPGDTLPLILYFSTDQVIEQDYTLFLHLADEKEQLLFQFDGVPAQGQHVTRQWMPSKTFADQYALTISEQTASRFATLSLGFYEYEEPSKRQPVVDQNGTPIGDRVVLGKIRLLDSDHLPSQVISETDVTKIAVWQPGIQLLNANVEQDQQGIPQQIQLTWRAWEHLHKDYTLFMQILDPHGQLMAQIDQQPITPTSTWLQGDIIQQQHHFTIDDTTTNWHQVIVGWYGRDGQRLLIQDESDESIQDHWVLLQRGGD